MAFSYFLCVWYQNTHHDVQDDSLPQGNCPACEPIIIKTNDTVIEGHNHQLLLRTDKEGHFGHKSLSSLIFVYRKYLHHW